MSVDNDLQGNRNLFTNKVFSRNFQERSQRCLRVWVWSPKKLLSPTQSRKKLCPRCVNALNFYANDKQHEFVSTNFSHIMYAETFQSLTSKIQDSPSKQILIFLLHQRKGLLPLLTETFCHRKAILHSHGMCLSIFCIPVTYRQNVNISVPELFCIKYTIFCVDENPDEGHSDTTQAMLD